VLVGEVFWIGQRESAENEGVVGEICTRICVPVVFVMRAVLFAHELLIHDFFEPDHFGGCVERYAIGRWGSRVSVCRGVEMGGGGIRGSWLPKVL
jgi:hypothetical protein